MNRPVGRAANGVGAGIMQLSARQPAAAAMAAMTLGPQDKIRHDLDAWRESFVTTILIGGDVGLLRTAAELILG